MRAKIAALLLMLSVVFPAEARGPYGSIAVAGWSGGAFADDNSGEFSNCIASAPYKSGINFGVLVSRLVGRLHLPMQAGPYLKVRDFRSFSASMDGGAAGCGESWTDGDCTADDSARCGGLCCGIGAAC